MSECAKAWIGIVLKLSGETEINRDVIVAAIEMIEGCLVEFGDSEDFLALEELEKMLDETWENTRAIPCLYMSIKN